MPELPEVEAIRRKLDQSIRGKVIESTQLLREKTFPNAEFHQARLIGQTIQAVTRRAKILQFVLDQDIDILAHLKMTGQFIYQDIQGQRIGGGHPTADWVNALPSKYTRFIFHFTDGSQLFFNDLRVFGWLKVYPKHQVPSVFADLGPDIVTPEEIRQQQIDEQHYTFLLDWLQKKAQRRQIPIKQFIMDNTLLCGVGNIYANEALFAVRISPLRPVSQLTEQEWQELLRAMKTIVLEAVRLGGTTFDGQYVNVDGFAGQFQRKLQVYGQENKPCARCGTPLQRIKQGGRSSFYCPNCQK